MRLPLSNFRILALGVILVALFVLLVGRLYYVQVARGAEYTAKIRDKYQVTVRVPAVRGEIMDRNGVPLVQNRSSFEVEFYLPEIVTAYRKVHKTVPKVTGRITVHGMLTDIEEPDVKTILEATVLPRLEELGIAHDYNSNRLQIHYRNETEVPYTYIEDLDFETMAQFSENNIGLPGVNVTVKPVRNYVYGSLASHVLGYTGAPTRVDREEARKYTFYRPDVEGKAQIELFLNDELKGEAGVLVQQRNARGVNIGDANLIEPKKGHDVWLTIDARIQMAAENALRAVGRGAAVVVDPNNGDILAMASVPSYDPNKFIPSISGKDWAELNKDDTNPLLNRAISAYAPGSTYKIPIALAGLRKGIGDQKFTCTGGVQYGDKYMRCWIADRGGAHGRLGLADAIKVSCNAFFYQYGNAAGIEGIVATGNMLGLGSKTGVPLSGEAPGVLPGPEWLATVNPQARWTSGLTANTSIGQGDVLASPLQMAMVTAAVANGGIAYEPKLVEKIVDQDGNVVREEPATIRADLVREGGLTAEQVEEVRKGMWKVVNEGGGTARKARIKDFEVAGKTGTAQFWRSGVKDNHTWFICFSPYEKPRYAVCVFVQGAHAGGAVSAPIAAKILEDCLKIEKQDEGAPKLAWLDPAVGNFKFVQSVDFGREIPATTTGGGSSSDDEETASAASSSGRSQESSRGSTPNIREDADEGGRVKNQEKPKRGLERFFNFKKFFGGSREKQKSEKPDSSPKPKRSLFGPRTDD